MKLVKRLAAVRPAIITASRALALVTLLAGALPLRSATTAAPFNYPAAIADARRAWNDDGRVIADLLRRLAAASSKARNAEANLDRERRALSDLETEREQALADLRSGAFCTGCGRTRSDLLAHGESFPHPGQRSRPATPAELDKAERDFDTRRDFIRKSITRLEPEFKSAQSEVTEAHHRLLVVLPVYHRHLAQEQENRLGKWLDEKTAAEAELKGLHENLTAKDREKAGGDESARAGQERVERQLNDRVTSSRLAEDRARQEERIFRKDVLASLDYLAGLAKSIPERYGVSGPFIAANIRNPPKPVGYTVPAIYVGGATSTVSDVQDLLNGSAKSATEKGKSNPPATREKSVRDLLEGR